MNKSVGIYQPNSNDFDTVMGNIAGICHIAVIGCLGRRQEEWRKDLGLSRQLSVQYREEKREENSSLLRKEEKRM